MDAPEITCSRKALSHCTEWSCQGAVPLRVCWRMVANFLRDHAPVAAVAVVCDVITRLDDGRDRKDQRILRVQALFEAICHCLLILIAAVEVEQVHATHTG